MSGQAQRMRATMHIVWEYVAEPHFYGTDDPAEMVDIDRENFEGDPVSFFPMEDTDGSRVIVTVEALGAVPNREAHRP